MNNQIQNDLKEAMKNQDKPTLAVLRMLKSALQLESINKKSDLTDDEVISVIKKQIKLRSDSIVEFEKFNKTVEIDNLNNEIVILKKYLPEELSEEEIDKKIDEVFNQLKPTSIKDMGNVMKELQCIASRTDMSIVSKKVKERLSI